MQGGRMFRKIALTASLIVAMALVANADTYQIDRTHSNIGFSVSHLTVSRVKGSFTDFSGTIQYDPADISKSSVEVEIKAYSVTTASEGRDRHLKSPDFFAVDSFPNLTFKSTKVTKKTDKTFEIVGDLTMRGVTKPVTLNAELIGMLEDPQMGKRLGFTATGRINRQEFGVRYNDMLDSGGLVAGNEIDILLEVEAAPPRERR
jgi:polyisoprenoid-binding protein YceI